MENGAAPIDGTVDGLTISTDGTDVVSPKRTVAGRPVGDGTGFVSLRPGGSTGGMNRKEDCAQATGSKNKIRRQETIPSCRPKNEPARLGLVFMVARIEQGGRFMIDNGGEGRKGLYFKWSVGSDTVSVTEARLKEFAIKRRTPNPFNRDRVQPGGAGTIER